MRTIVFLSVALVACGNKSSSDKSTCQALAISATNSKALLDLATTQYLSADHAMAKWEQWQKKTVTEDQDGTGEYSRAGDRASRYRAAGDALCVSTTLSYWQMRELARSLGKQSLSAAFWHLTDFHCGTTKSPISPSVDVRKTFMDDWKWRVAHIQAISTRVVDQCFSTQGGAEQEMLVPPTFLPTE